MSGAGWDTLMMLFYLHQGKNWKPQNQNWIQPKSWSIQTLMIQLRWVMKLWKKLNSLKHKVKHTTVSRTVARKRYTAAASDLWNVSLTPDLSWSMFSGSSVTISHLCCVFKSLFCGVKQRHRKQSELYFKTFFLFNFPPSVAAASLRSADVFFQHK